jgi:hypothetical protein
MPLNCQVLNFVFPRGGRLRLLSQRYATTAVLPAKHETRNIGLQVGTRTLQNMNMYVTAAANTRTMTRTNHRFIF